MDVPDRLNNKRADAAAQSCFGPCDHDHTSNRASLMNCPPPIILAPQPQRSLKRRFGELDPEEEENRNKRQRLFDFLDSIPEPLTRCRSDSYLVLKMSPRPQRERKPKKHFDELSETSTAPSRRTSSSTFAPSARNAGSKGTTPSIASSKTSSSSQSWHRLTAQPGYRDSLHANNIIFVSPQEAPPELLEHVRSITNRTRDSPGLSSEEAEAAVTDLATLRHDGDEVSLHHVVTEHRLIPPRSLHPDILYTGDRPFSRNVLPQIDDQLALARPVPDTSASYKSTAFTPLQLSLLMKPPLYPFSRPATSGFFAQVNAEYKCLGRGGNLWVGENQVVTTGAVCVHSMAQLYAAINEYPEYEKTLTFSYLLTERFANIWVHFQNEEKKFMNIDFVEFSFAGVEGVRGFRNTIRNLADWQATTRFQQLIDVLNKLGPRYVDNKGRTRTSSVFSEESSVSKRQAGENPATLTL